MQRLLDRELTADEQAQQARIWTAFDQRGGSQAIHATIRDLAEQDPELFFTAALALLESAPDPHICPNLYPALLDCPPFLIQLIRPDRFSRDQVIETCRNFIRIYTRLDIRLARLAPGRSEDQYRLEVPYIVRILEILNEISAGPKLVLIMNHLTRHPDSRVASKALLLMGRRIQNRSWVERNVKSEDPRKRASVVEALWCRNNVWSRQTMWAALKDENNRVVGNALVGLHSLGESRVGDLVRCMLSDARPHFRFTAAWVMGKMGDLEFLEPLREALADPDQRVRQAARRALVTIRRPIVRQQQLEMMALAESVQAETSTATLPELPPAAQPAAAVPTPGASVPPKQPDQAPAEPRERKHPDDPEFNLHFDGSYISRR